MRTFEEHGGTPTLMARMTTCLIKCSAPLLFMWCSAAFAGTAQNPVVQRLEDVSSSPVAGNPWISDVAFRIAYDVSASPAT